MVEFRSRWDIIVWNQIVENLTSAQISWFCWWALSFELAEISQKPKMLTRTVFLMKGNYFLLDMPFDYVPYFPQDRKRSQEWPGNITDGRKVTPANRNGQEEQNAWEKNNRIASKCEECHGELGDPTTKFEDVEEGRGWSNVAALQSLQGEGVWGEMYSTVRIRWLLYRDNPASRALGIGIGCLGHIPPFGQPHFMRLLLTRDIIGELFSFGNPKLLRARVRR